MESIQRTVEVNAPLGAVYEQWTRVEEFPRFMKSLREVRQIAEGRYYWRAEHGGVPYEAIEQISLKIPNRRIAWRNVSGSENSGLVNFERLAETRTRVSLEMAYEPDSGWHEPAALGARIERILEAFKALMEPGFVEAPLHAESPF